MKIPKDLDRFICLGLFIYKQYNNISENNALA